MQNPGVIDEALRNQSKSIRRALAVVQSMVGATSEGRSSSLSELAARNDLNKSTLLRLLEPLLEARLVERTSDAGYRIGLGAVNLGTAYLTGLDLRTVARPILEQIAHDSGETVHLLAYDRGQVCYIEKIVGRSSIQMASRIGERMPAYCTASGKVFLAHLPEAEVREVLAEGLPARTSNTITDPKALQQELANTRERGVGIDDCENELDIRCVSVPVFDNVGQVTAAISISGLAARMRGERMTELTAVVQAGAQDLSERLGAGNTLPESTLNDELDKENLTA